MLNPNYYENSGVNGVAVLEVLPKKTSRSPQARMFVPLKSTTLEGTVSGPLGEFSVTHTYEFSSDDYRDAVEAVYRFPLPGDAAVTGVAVKFGEVSITTELVAREAAESTYEAARNEGRQAVLLTRESPDVFTLFVSGISPDQRVTVTTNYVQLARPKGAGWSLRIPLTTAPRYTRVDEATNRHAKGQPLSLMRDPGHTFSTRVHFELAEVVTSPTHALTLETRPTGLEARLAEDQLVPDRDLVFEWQPIHEPDQVSLRPMVHDGEHDQYFMALVTPPTQDSQVAAREVILLVDRSGSMHGPKWQAADWAVKRFLSGLSRHDSFALGLFHTRVRWFSNEPQPGTMAAVNEAFAFLDGHNDSGGTELGVALEQALCIAREPGERSRHILIVTDAEVSDAARILRLADQEYTSPQRRRISVLCIDAAPNSYLAHELAERGGGAVRFLTSDPTEADIATTLDELLTEWERPTVPGLSLVLNRPLATVVGHRVSARPNGTVVIDVGDLVAERPVWIAGKVPRDPGLPLQLSLEDRGGKPLSQANVSVLGGSLPGLRQLIGAYRVMALEELTNGLVEPDEVRLRLAKLGFDLAADEGQASSLYPENQRHEIGIVLKRILVGEALAAGIACSETAFVAHREQAGSRVTMRVAVSNALPHGWDPGFAVQASPAVLRSERASLSGSTTAPHAKAAMPPMMGLLASDVHMSMSRAAPAGPIEVFSGSPRFEQHHAVLFDSDLRPHTLPDEAYLTNVVVSVPRSAGHDKLLGLDLLVFVDDMISPRARIKVRDLLRQGGERPLNILRRANERIAIILEEPGDSSPEALPQFAVLVGYR